MRRLLAVVLAALMALGAVPAMAAATDAALTFVVADEVTGTDIQMITWENLVHALIYAPLVLMDETNTSLTPNMVSAVTVENDGKDIVFTIPEGICFSNGDPVTAEAVAANFERYRNVSVYASDLDPVTSIETAGDKVIFHCDKAAPYLGAMLVSSYSGVDNVAAIAEGGERCVQPVRRHLRPVFRLRVDPVASQQIVLTRNENYKSFNPSSTNKGPVYPAQITIRFISDDYTRVNELLSGSVDYIDAVPAANLSELQSAPGVVLAHTMQPGCDFLLLNTKAPILADYNVRLAIAKGINRQELCAAQDDTIIPADGFLTPAQIGYSAESAASLAEKYAYDPEGAKKRLADAGWADSDATTHSGTRTAQALL
jgi:peptide/nickel transport system substrate-binding protein